MTFEQTLFSIGFIAIMFFGLVVPCILTFGQASKERNKERKSNKERNQFIDSIKPGDVFDWDDRDARPYRNPFDEPDNSSLILRTTIIDVKTNEAGVKWVKYYYTCSGPNGMWFTDKLDDYLKYRYRIQEAE